MPIPGCHCLNLVTAVIDFYKRQPPPKRLKTIKLDAKHWTLFVEDLKRLNLYDPELEEKNKDCEIHAMKGVQLEGWDGFIKKGSMFQKKEMEYEFYESKEDEIVKAN